MTQSHPPTPAGSAARMAVPMDAISVELRARAAACAARGDAVSAWHALILITFARLFAVLEAMFNAWKAGLLPHATRRITRRITLGAAAAHRGAAEPRMADTFTAPHPSLDRARPRQESHADGAHRDVSFPDVSLPGDSVSDTRPRPCEPRPVRAPPPLRPAATAHLYARPRVAWRRHWPPIQAPSHAFSASTTVAFSERRWGRAPTRVLNVP